MRRTGKLQISDVIAELRLEAKQARFEGNPEAGQVYDAAADLLESAWERVRS